MRIKRSPKKETGLNKKESDTQKRPTRNIFSSKFYRSHGVLKSWLVKFGAAFLGFVLLLVILAYTAIGVIYFKFGIKLNPISAIKLAITYVQNKDDIKRSDEELKVDKEADKIYSEAGVTNIMLYGIDSRSKDEESRSDAIMLLTIDKSNKKIKMTSIARDTYVSIPGYFSDKVNHAFVYGWHNSKKETRKDKISDGAALSISTINSNFGLNVRDYITIDFWTLASVVDYVGGVNIDVDSAERYDINWRLIPHINQMGIKCSKIPTTGMQTLSGGQALAYCRERYIDGDVQRGARQREVLMAIFEKAGSLDPSLYTGLLQLILNDGTTSLDFNELYDLGMWAISAKADLKFENLGLPTEDIDTGGQYINGVWYYTYDLEAAKRKIQDFILENNTEQGGVANVGQ